MSLNELIANNRAWSEGVRQRDPGFFERLVRQQSPRYLWIGCADSRVPANEIVDLHPGELFVHRNVANVVVHSDLNCLSVIQYAVEVLRVEHVIVCGHYGCGGVEHAWKRERLGLIDNWLGHVQDVAEQHRARFSRLMTQEQATTMLTELNVIEQAVNVSRTTILLDAWRRGQPVTVHAWIYSLRDGLIRDLAFSAARDSSVEEQYRAALAAVDARAAAR